MGDTDVMLAAGGVSKNRRFAGRRSPTTGHRRRLRSPDSRGQEHIVAVRRSLSTPGDVLTGKPSESSEGESVLPSSGKEVTRVSTDSGTSDSEVPQKPTLRKKTKARGHKSDEGEREKNEKESWWRTMASWAQRGKSLEREVGAELKAVTRRRHRSLTEPSPEIGESPPVVKKRGKVKPREPEKRISVEDSSDDFWKPAEVAVARAAEEAPTEKSETSKERTPKEERKKLLGRSKSVEEQVNKREKSTEKATSHELEEEVKRTWWKLSTQLKNEKRDDREPLIADKPTAKEVERASWVKLVLESKSLWTSFRAEHAEDVATLKRLRNRCIASLLILAIYCGLGGVMFRIVEGAFESFYKCGVKRVKRDFVDGLWTGSHHLREDEWKSLARRHLMQFEEQLHAAYEAGMTSYSGQRAWSFLNAVSYCLTVITTIGYGHISPSTTTGRALTIAYAIFGIPMFLILLADFGKLFTRGMKFGWAFVRRLYYTGSCRTVRRTAPVQEVMKGVQLVYDMAMFRRPSQLPPGVEGLSLGVDGPPPLPPRPPYSPTEPPSTPALSNFAIDDEFNLPISVAIVVLLGYIFCGATVFYWWETWGFFESFYFVFISMSTIGFGDFVPQNHMYMMASIVYLVFGLALTSMCINVVQEKLSDSFRQASAKIGATIGLRMAEEEGATIKPPGVVPVELPEVHKAARHQASSAT